jgi:hypothetical protein
MFSSKKSQLDVPFGRKKKRSKKTKAMIILGFTILGGSIAAALTKPPQHQ